MPHGLSPDSFRVFTRQQASRHLSGKCVHCTTRLYPGQTFVVKSKRHSCQGDSKRIDLVPQMGPVRIHHSSHDFATQSSHFVDRAGWKAKMASIEFWMPWRNAHKPHWSVGWQPGVTQQWDINSKIILHSGSLVFGLCWGIFFKQTTFLFTKSDKGIKLDNMLNKHRSLKLHVWNLCHSCAFRTICKYIA